MLSEHLESFSELRFFDRFQTRTRRRAIAVGFIATLGTFPLIAWLTGNYPWSLAMLLPYTALLVLLDGSTRGVTQRSESRLDEREKELQGSTFTRAYWLGAMVGLGGGIIAYRLITINSDLGAGTLVLVVGLLLGLPAITAAWTQPTEVGDEE